MAKKIFYILKPSFKNLPKSLPQDCDAAPKMKIIHALGNYFPVSHGGIEVIVAGLCRRMRAAGYEVLVAAADRNYRSYLHEHTPVYCYSVSKRATRDEIQQFIPLRSAEYFRTWIVEQKPTIFHVHFISTGLGLEEIKVAKSTGARIIVTEYLPKMGYLCQRGTMMRWGEQICDGICQPAKCAACYLHHRGLPKPVASTIGILPSWVSRTALKLSGRLSTAFGMNEVIRLRLKMQHKLVELADKIVLQNEWARKIFEANGAPSEKLVVNHTGVSQENIKKKPGPEVRPTRTPITIGYLGRFDPMKGVYDLARAVRSLPPDTPIRVRFRGPINNSRHQSVVTELRKIVGNDPRVSFDPGVPPEHSPEILASYDVLCCPSICLEGGPVVAVEAFAVGTPIIGTRIGGLTEIVQDGINGRLISPGDWRALAELFQTIVRNPAETVDQWRNNIPKVRTMDEVTADYLNLYLS